MDILGTMVAWVGAGPLAASSLSVFFSVMEQVYERG